MRLLMLGGTAFLGRHLVEDALARGHEVTLFNRGQRNPDLFPQVEHLRGDRDGGLDALAGRRWDVAIDTSGYFPRLVRASAELLASAVEHYTIVSSISVYANFSRIGITEDEPVGTLADESVEEVTGETYGPLKALCERAAEAAMPGRVLVVRPGLIVGPYDPTDRFTYWPHRIAQGGEVLVPEPPDRSMQIIDARDLAAWMLTMAQQRQTGVYHATGPAGTLTMREIFDTCKAETASDAAFTWVAEPFLEEQKVGPWIELPLWIPGSDADMAGFKRVNCQKALAAGLTFRTLAATVRDTFAWDASRPADTERKAGLTREREAELLAAWHSRAEA